eukprot:7179188-Pyramimonas_sp.AAC.1
MDTGTDPGVINLVELPREWWPKEWFYDEACTRPRYQRPAVPLVYALPGHSKSGNIWETHADTVFVIKLTGWKKVEGWHSVWVHCDGSTMVIYVGDFMLAATAANARKHWEELGRRIVFQEQCADVFRHVGAIYNFDKVDYQRPLQPRTMVTNMSSYLLNVVKKFTGEYTGALRKATTPFPPETESWAPADDEPGVFQTSAASFVASGLYASLVSRPDLSVAIQRLCSRVTKWSVTDDVSLIRLMAYMQEHHDL